MVKNYKCTLKEILLFLIFLFPLTVYSQIEDSVWHANRSEYVFGIGPSSAFTDIGGSVLNGTHFLRDFNSSATRIGGFIGYRKRISNALSIKGIITGGEIYGNDNLSENTFRYNRNQDFRSQIIEPSIQVEYHFFKAKNKFKQDTIIEREKGHLFRHWDLYAFSGIGAFYFNVQGKYNGGPLTPPGMNINEWYELRPLSTEGEGLPGGPSEYTPFAICFPLGIGLKYVLNKNWSIGLELSDRIWTSTDYLDDTHGNYFNNSEILKYKGSIAAYFADPSKNLIADQDLVGQERGDPKYNDSYMFVFFCINYHLIKHH
jgi:hypothetical protein